jgi:hypothetical protein
MYTVLKLKMKCFVGVTDNDWFAFLSQQRWIDTVNFGHFTHDEFDNGGYYYTFHGKRLHVHPNKEFQPSPKFLTWHKENIFRGYDAC